MSHTICTLTTKILHQDPITYCKFGDGEYLCMIGSHGANCDKTPYTPKLQSGLINI